MDSLKENETANSSMNGSSIFSRGKVSLDTTVFYLEILRAVIALVGILLSMVAIITIRTCKGTLTKIKLIVWNICIGNIMCNIPTCFLLGSHTMEAVLPNFAQFRCPLLVLKGLCFRTGGLVLACSNICLAGNMAFSFWLPLKYRFSCQSRRTTLYITIIWLPSCLFMLYSVLRFIILSQDNSSVGCFDFSVILVSTIGISTLAMFILLILNFVLYFAGFISMYFWKRRDLTNKYRMQQEVKRKNKILILAFIITVSYLICMMPALLYFAVCNLAKVCPQLMDQRNILEQILLLMRMANGIFNPIICFTSNNYLRQVVRQWCTRCCRRSVRGSDVGRHANNMNTSIQSLSYRSDERENES